MLWSRPRLAAGESIGSQTRSASDIESQKEAKHVSSSRIRFAPAVAGRVFRVPRHRVLYPHSPVIGRSFHHLPFHARCCFCGLTTETGRLREGAPPWFSDSQTQAIFPARIIAVCLLHKAKEQ
jgi:hypothetical protein